MLVTAAGLLIACMEVLATCCTCPYKLLLSNADADRDTGLHQKMSIGGCELQPAAGRQSLCCMPLLVCIRYPTDLKTHLYSYLFFVLYVFALC